MEGHKPVALYGAGSSPKKSVLPGSFSASGPAWVPTINHLQAGPDRRIGPRPPSFASPPFRVLICPGSAISVDLCLCGQSSPSFIFQPSTPSIDPRPLPHSPVAETFMSRPRPFATPRSLNFQHSSFNFQLLEATAVWPAPESSAVAVGFRSLSCSWLYGKNKYTISLAPATGKRIVYQMI